LAETVALFDPTDPDVNQQSVPHEHFRRLRATAPVHWVDQTPEATAGMVGPAGYWAISKHRHVMEVSLNNRDFSSSENTAIIRFAPGTPREVVEMQRTMMLNNDPPTHTHLRKVISRGFTPRAIGLLSDGLRDRAGAIVEAARAKGSGDFVADIAAELPLYAIADLLGLPEPDRAQVFAWTNEMMAFDDPEIDADPAQSFAAMMAYFDQLVRATK
jgi:cholest-4-en-3-one 26-monooxygenase